jgi:polysaccharide pyruvyl transferase WcaK-like protein
MKAHKRILIVNAWGNNKGDQAMINGLVRMLKSIDRDLEIDAVPLRNEDLDLDPDVHILRGRVGLYFYSSVLRRLLPKEEKDQRRFSRSVFYLWFFLNWAFGFFSMRFLKEYDLIIHAPQGQTLSSNHSLRYHTIWPLVAARALNIPYMIIGVTVGPFSLTPERLDGLLLTIFEHSRLTIIREGESLHYLNNKFSHLEKVHKSIDIVFNAKTEKQTIDARSATAVESERRKASGSIGATVSRTGIYLRNNPEAYKVRMASFFDDVIAASGRKLSLFPHITGDHAFLQQIRAQMTHQESVTIIPEELDSDEIQRVFEVLEFFISARYHSTVFAIKKGIPFMAIIEHFKTQGLLGELGLDHGYCGQNDPIEKLNEAFREAWSRRAKIRSQTLLAREKALDKASVYDGLLLEVLNGVPAVQDCGIHV